jgi:hypothetical protein
MMNARSAALLVLVAAAALLTAGCGGGGSESQPLSKAEYAARLDTICAATNEAGKSLDLSSMTKLAANGDKAKDLLDTMANKIDKLEPPAEVKDSAKSFVAGLKQEAGKFGEMTQAAKAGDAQKVQSIQSDLASEAAATGEDARFIGATGCARLFS